MLAFLYHVIIIIIIIICFFNGTFYGSEKMLSELNKVFS